MLTLDIQKFTIYVKVSEKFMVEMDLAKVFGIVSGRIMNNEIEGIEKFQYFLCSGIAKSVQSIIEDCSLALHAHT